MNGSHGAFFNDDDTRTVTALTERLMPGAPGAPGPPMRALPTTSILHSRALTKTSNTFIAAGSPQLDAHCKQAYSKPFAI